MRKLLAIDALAEIATGIVALAVPDMLARLLFGVELPAAGIAAVRCFGLAIVGLGIACWPGAEATRAAWRGMLVYNVLIAGYLGIVGASGETRGVLLWPVVAIHAAVALIFVRLRPGRARPAA